MSNRKISELDDLSEVTSDDLAVVVDISTLTTRKASMANLKSYFQSELPRPFQQLVTITTEMVESKSLTLTKSPLPSYNVVILPRGGCPQFSNEDFTVEGLTLSWDGYDMDGLLEAGDIVQVDYYY